MSGYEKQSWTNDQYNTSSDVYTIEDLGDGTFRIKRAGTRLVEGTTLNATRMGHLETQYDEVKAELAKEEDGDIAVHGANLVGGSVLSAALEETLTGKTLDQAVIGTTGAETDGAVRHNDTDKLLEARLDGEWEALATRKLAIALAVIL